MGRTHRKIMTQTHGVDVGGGGAETYLMSFPRILTLVEFLVEGCPSRAPKPVRLHENFMYRHWKSKISILQEGTSPLTRCTNCRIHIIEARLERHNQAARCDTAMEMRMWQRDV